MAKIVLMFFALAVLCLLEKCAWQFTISWIHWPESCWCSSVHIRLMMSSTAAFYLWVQVSYSPLLRFQGFLGIPFDLGKLLWASRFWGNLWTSKVTQRMSGQFPFCTQSGPKAAWEMDLAPGKWYVGVCRCLTVHIAEQSVWKLSDLTST